MRTFKLIDIKTNKSSVYKTAIYSISDQPDKVLSIQPHNIYANLSVTERDKRLNKKFFSGGKLI